MPNEPSFVRRLAPVVALALAVAAVAAPAPGAVAVVPPVCIAPQPFPPPPAALTPWFYKVDDGDYVWGDHQYYEDPGNTVFSLVRDLVSLGGQQPAPRPDVLLFNFAQFDPPEGVAVAAGGKRRLMAESIEDKGLQLLVNYSDALIDPAFANRYFKPTFFVSLDGVHQNPQTIPPVRQTGFSIPFVSATRGAFGCAFAQVHPHTGVPIAVELEEGVDPAGPPAEDAAEPVPIVTSCDELYVTAGLPYGLVDLDPDPAHQVLAAQSQKDLLMRRNATTGIWTDAADDPCPTGPRIPASAKAGNSSGVVFADLTGDGFADLYVGLQGDNYLGAKNVLLVNDGTGCFTDQTLARIPGELVRATNEVAASDLDHDGDLDLAIANRCRRSGSCGVEAEDYVLINNGSGVFAVQALAAGVFTDSRSVAAGDLNHDTWPEIVLGNAGSDGWSNALALTPAEDHRMEIFVNNAALGGALNTFTDFMFPILDTTAPSFFVEHELTAPLTQQVLLVDLFGPPSATPTPQTNVPDGWLDLVIVNHRDILKHDAFVSASSRVWIATNTGDWAGPAPWLRPFTAWGSPWIRTVAVGDFDGNGFRDLYEGRGNRWSGVLGEVHSNLGSTGTPGQPWDYGDGFIGAKSYQTVPGTEHGYGFDFADVDNDGAVDAFQSSRAYDYFVKAILSPTLDTDHVDLADPTIGLGPGRTDNRRGRQIPQGMEDGAFADFDRDGDLDALLASQRTPGWGHCPDTSPDSMLLVNNGAGQFGYDAQYQAATCSMNDGRIDLNGRTTAPLPSIGDRVVVGDLDNDGKQDAIVHLFEIHPSGTPFEPYLPVLPPQFPAPIASYSFGWRYLSNIQGVAGSGNVWFRDLAPTRMKNAAGVFDPNWNRGLGMDLLADFDNNGALDLYTTVGFAKTSAQVVNVQQTDDLLFLNGVGGNPKGTLVESGGTTLPARCLDVVQDWPGEPTNVSCGSFGIAQGDVDNDGDADVVVAHYGQSGRTNYPWLLVNRLNEPVAQLVDEFQTRVPINALSPTIHTASTDFVGFPTPGMDRAMFPTLADFDADGDLDLIYQVVDDLPRVLDNVGTDSNGDGLITAADNPPPGTFVDVTDTVLKRLKATTDSQDLVAVDIDRDGDYDLANDPFSDRVTFWRNDLPKSSGVPAVAEIWPRVGSIRRQRIRLEGVNLTNVVKVQFRYAGGAFCEQTATTPIGTDGKHLDVVIPQTCPLGLAQVRVLRAAPACPGGATIQIWSKMYFGYFIQG